MMRWLFLALLLAGPCHATDFYGRVVGVHDGDTLTVLVDRRPIKVRIAEIDAPELKQAFGQRARQSLAEICFHKPARIRASEKDRYGRTTWERRRSSASP